MILTHLCLTNIFIYLLTDIGQVHEARKIIDIYSSEKKNRTAASKKRIVHSTPCSI